MSDRNVPAEALLALPVFPLSGTLLLPHTFASLHVFEPRYRAMIADIVDGARAFSIALLDDRGEPDEFARPPFHPIAGVGILRRSARLPDGRYNVLVEGIARVDVSDELPPDPRFRYRRARARLLADVLPEDPTTLQPLISALSALTTHVVHAMGGDTEIVKRLAELDGSPGKLADTVAEAAIQDTLERQQYLSELDVKKRIELASSALGALYLRSQEEKLNVPKGALS
ncbi:MAG: LON peptidase substrate-binding domain-containing protein [Deltaproteobacteria bacterium]|nr:LON peptidase substrate-binding domain-containing protein [Deltaproteobacteria bacterium]